MDKNINNMKVHGDIIPQSVEYRGMNEWGVHWNVEEEVIAPRDGEPTHKQYVYDEWIFNEEPTYDLFVSRYIRQKYTSDQEDAIKSNTIQDLIDSKPVNNEWIEFEAYRNKAKKIGREIFKIE